MDSKQAVVLFFSLIIIESLALNLEDCNKPNAGFPIVFDTVSLGDFHMRTYEKAMASSASRFYFAPLALLEHTSASSGRNNLTGENQLVFRVEMWNDELHYIVKDHLSNITGLSMAENRVNILPFEKVSLRCQRCSPARSDSRWRSFSQSPKHMEFRMVCTTLEECHNLREQMIHHPEQFSSHLMLFFRMEGNKDSIRRKSASVTSEHIWNGPIMLDLNRRFSNSSFALVTSHDRGRIVSETLENVLADVEISLESAEDLAIEPEDELRLRKMMENVLFENYIIPLEDDSESAWNSLYWDYENVGLDVRPDIMARKLNKLYQNVEEKDRKWIIEQFSHGPGLSSTKTILSDETSLALANIFQTIPTHIGSRLLSSQRNIQWDGHKFLPKVTKLFRINLDKLRHSFKPVRNVPVKYSVIDLRLDLNVQPAMSRINFERQPQIPEFRTARKGNEEMQTTVKPDERLLTSDTTGNESSPGVLQGLFQTIRGAITGGGIETAPYTVIRQEKEYEERLYPAQKWVRTQMKNISKDGASSAMFWKLFNYISGQNAKQTKIPMTAPVTVFIEPGSGPNCESTFTMAFYVPSGFQEDTPEPTADDVSIEERPEFKVLARVFQGPTDDTAFVEQAVHFGELIQSNKETGVVFDTYFFVQYYNGNPGSAEINEIWFKKSD
ncbi:uncharacterized protein LOC130695556 isoform X2 [Daphnia carinata]|uniref:uncharacterized protein LOC130695556 isoform X2 n=1 Tax=Daphnia carinata TaxID=120202 RepID=UPI00257FB81B|nr:uncharacterized protein LOC130695556 isoform X2 [Daphnia carinata]